MEMGKFEFIFGAISVGAGFYIGYKLGGEAVQYAKTITETPDLLGYIISQHPILTRILAIYGFGEILGRIGGGICGKTIDALANSDNKFNDWYIP